MERASLNELVERLPGGVRERYAQHIRKSSPVVERLKVACALRLWNLGYENIYFERPFRIPGSFKICYVKVYGENDGGGAVMVECASRIRLSHLRRRSEFLRLCKPENADVVLAFPADTLIYNADFTRLFDEYWRVKADGTIETQEGISLCIEAFWNQGLKRLLKRRRRRIKQ